jgi:hypothetical protein
MRILDSQGGYSIVEGDGGVVGTWEKKESVRWTDVRVYREGMILTWI